MLISSQAIYLFFSQFIKSVGKNKEFALSGIALTFFIAITSIVFIKYWKLGILGYMLSYSLSNVVLSVIIIVFLNIPILNITRDKINIEKIKELVAFSIPLVPNAIAWWTASAINRYFILFFLGSYMNGIFAVANKIPALLTVATTIFSQSWQISAIEESNEKDSALFFERVFSYYVMITFLVSSVLVGSSKLLVKILASQDYYSAWKYIPFVLLSVIYTSFSGFFGQFYIVAKLTKGIFVTTVIGAIVNVILNFLFIPLLGLNGTAISSMCAFFIMWIIRISQTKKFIQININKKLILISHVIIFLQIICLWTLSNLKLYWAEILLFLLMTTYYGVLLVKNSNKKL